jgi:hypothetical protein
VRVGDTYSVGSIRKSYPLPLPSPEEGSRSSFWNVFSSVFQNTGRWTKSRNQVILSVIPQRQNPLESTCYSLFNMCYMMEVLGCLCMCVCERSLHEQVPTFCNSLHVAIHYPANSPDIRYHLGFDAVWLKFADIFKRFYRTGRCHVQKIALIIVASVRTSNPTPDICLSGPI